MEVGRAVLVPGVGKRVRQDISVDWHSLRGAKRQITGTVSAKYSYVRSAEAEKTLSKATNAFREKKHKEAIKLLKPVVEKDPNDFLAWTVLGMVYLADGQLSEASRSLETALELRPDFALALISLGKLELAQKNFDKAIELLSRAVKESPESADANHALGEAYLQIKKGSLAVGYLNRAIELAPLEKAEVHLRLAALYHGAGLKERAAAEYKAFLGKVKNHPERERIEQYIKENSSN
jgi:tetratricopeptide (TPR) repeat protein